MTISSPDLLAEFLSTPSARRATCGPHPLPHGGRNFYPRPPRGGRHRLRRRILRVYDFYPRPPRGGRRGSGISAPTPDNFYPRPPRGGRLPRILPRSQTVKYFYPRPPRGGRLTPCRWIFSRSRFLSTPSARRATEAQKINEQIARISIHALREEGDRWPS